MDGPLLDGPLLDAPLLDAPLDPDEAPPSDAPLEPELVCAMLIVTIPGAEYAAIAPVPSIPSRVSARRREIVVLVLSDISIPLRCLCEPVGADGDHATFTAEHILLVVLPDAECICQRFVILLWRRPFPDSGLHRQAAPELRAAESPGKSSRLSCRIANYGTEVADRF